MFSVWLASASAIPLHTTPEQASCVEGARDMLWTEDALDVRVDAVGPGDALVFDAAKLSYTRDGVVLAESASDSCETAVLLARSWVREFAPTDDLSVALPVRPPPEPVIVDIPPPEIVTPRPARGVLLGVAARIPVRGTGLPDGPIFRAGVQSRLLFADAELFVATARADKLTDLDRSLIDAGVTERADAHESVSLAAFGCFTPVPVESRGPAVAPHFCGGWVVRSNVVRQLLVGPRVRVVDERILDTGPGFGAGVTAWWREVGVRLDARSHVDRLSIGWRQTVLVSVGLVTRLGQW